MVSTISSPVFSEVLVVYRDYDIYPTLSNTQTIGTIPARIHTHFAALREMRKARAFRLVFCVDVWVHPVADAVRLLEQAVAAERAKTGFDDFISESLVVPSSHRSGSRWIIYPSVGRRRLQSLR